MTTPSPEISADAANTTRKALRQQLLAAREQMPDAQRIAACTHIAGTLSRWLAQHAPHAGTIALYSAHRGEVDLSAWALTRGEQLALPIAQPGKPLLFARWQPGDALVKDQYGIGIPAQVQVVQPDVLLIPCVGFTLERLRLGYGGGYYDRTLNAMRPRPRAVGLAFAQQQCSFAAQAHDVALDAIITEAGVL
jgi:5-formyltetrahydrofolate cyclo-ligase